MPFRRGTLNITGAGFIPRRGAESLAVSKPLEGVLFPMKQAGAVKETRARLWLTAVTLDLLQYPGLVCE